jgi:hypothetical protein
MKHGQFHTSHAEMSHLALDVCKQGDLETTRTLHLCRGRYLAHSSFLRISDMRWHLCEAQLIGESDRSQEFIVFDEPYRFEFGNLAWPISAVCFGPPCGTLMVKVFGSAGA